MHSLGSYHLSGSSGRPHIVQVVLSRVSDPRDVLWEAASNGRPQRTASARQTARTRGQIVSSQLADVSGLGWSWGSGCGLGSSRRNAICIYLVGVALFLVDEEHPMNSLRGCEEGIQCAEMQDDLPVRLAAPPQVLKADSSSRGADQG